MQRVQNIAQKFGEVEVEEQWGEWEESEEDDEEEDDAEYQYQCYNEETGEWEDAEDEEEIEVTEYWDEDLQEWVEEDEAVGQVLSKL